MKKLLKFTVILMDPPWRDTSVKLKYPLMESKEWMDLIDFDLLQDSGFVLIWVANKKLEDAINFMRNKGYVYETIATWVKVDKFGLKQRNMPGGAMWHGKEDCVVFTKVKSTKFQGFADMRKAVNVIHAPLIGRTSTKPFQFYESIEQMVKD